MAVSYSMVDQNTTQLPSNAGPTSYANGFNIAGGFVDEVILRVTLATAAAPLAADLSNIVSSLRLVLNGSTTFQFNSGYSLAANNGPGQLGYFLNSLGDGRFVEVPNDTAKEAYFRIPVGRQLAAGISRMEIALAWSATASAVNSGTVEWWVRYNSAPGQSTTTVSANTSYTHAIAQENVVVRLPAGVPGTVAGVLIQNDSAADQMNGLRLLSQSTYQIDTDMWRAFNSDLYNNILYADAGTSTTQQTIAIAVQGGLFLPTFGLTTDSDLVLQVDSTAATTRTYTPVITSPVTSATEPQGRQTTPLRSNVSAAVVARAED